MTEDLLFNELWYHIVEHYEYEFVNNNSIKIEYGTTVILSRDDIYEYEVFILAYNGVFYCERVKVLLEDKTLSQAMWDTLESIGLYKEEFIK